MQSPRTKIAFMATARCHLSMHRHLRTRALATRCLLVPVAGLIGSIMQLPRVGVSGEGVMTMTTSIVAPECQEEWVATILVILVLRQGTSNRQARIEVQVQVQMCNAVPGGGAEGRRCRRCTPRLATRGVSP
jgi:hypothetical protein